jgi:glycosyltransferase involved in cell wall biosynthesis
MSTVDIIIPTFKREQILKRTLDHVKDQSFEDWHCWIAEDGDTPDCRNAVEPYLSDSRFTFLPGKHSGSPSAPRNRALISGKSPFVAFLDDDDIWLPEKLSKQIQFLDAHPECVILGSQCFRLQDDNADLNSLPFYYKNFELEQIDYFTLIQHNPLMNSTVVIRRWALTRSGLQNSMLDRAGAEDYDLWLRIGVLGEIWRLPEPLIIYRDIPKESIRSVVHDQKTFCTILINAFESALTGDGKIPSPLQDEKYVSYATAIKNRIDELIHERKSLSTWSIMKKTITQKIHRLTARS